SVGHASAGMRTAINLQGVEKGAIQRGDMVAKPGTLRPTYMLDVMIHFLNSNPKSIKNRTRVRVHTGTSEVLGNLVLMESEELPPGETTVAQIRFDTPVTAVKGDRFVVRSYSPIRTIGGGQILNPIPPKHKRFQPRIITGLKTVAEADPETIIVHHLKEAGHSGLSTADLLLMTSITRAALGRKLDALVSRKAIALTDKESHRYVHAESIENIKADVTRYLVDYHDQHPLKPGMPKEELKSKFPVAAIDSKLFFLGMNDMLAEKAVFQEEETLRLATYTVSLKGEQSKIKTKIMAVYEKNGLTPPYFKDVCSAFDLDPSVARDILMVLVDEGRVIKVKEDLFFDVAAIEKLKSRLVEFLKQNNEITTPQIKALTGVSRKYVIPLIEYFDTKQVTIRIGDIRKLRARSNT
ncbi:MAG: SelB C-terminal domain-containing protein, partial [Deltaproteobacteria bacterium]|nr:SelB C-terminal domain-containing protein [Deltaproteobacteria bacterium]